MHPTYCRSLKQQKSFWLVSRGTHDAEVKCSQIVNKKNNLISILSVLFPPHFKAVLLSIFYLHQLKQELHSSESISIHFFIPHLHS